MRYTERKKFTEKMQVNKFEKNSLLQKIMYIVLCKTEGNICIRFFVLKIYQIIWLYRKYVIMTPFFFLKK